MRQKDATVAVSNLKTLTQVMTEELSSVGIINGLFFGFALLALALAAAGLYGVISYSVGQRRREFGVRLALGAAPSSIRRMILGEGLRVVGIGAVIGLIMAAGLAYAARSLLYGISAADPVTFAARHRPRPARRPRRDVGARGSRHASGSGADVEGRLARAKYAT